MRSASVKGGTLALTGDTREASPLEIWAPAGVRNLTWNDAKVAFARTPSGSLAATAPLPGPADFALPALAGWRTAPGSPEADPGFDDSDWQKIDNRAYASITARADGQPNMLMDAYGFHEGDVWYRGRFTGSTDAQRVNVYYGAGGSGMAGTGLILGYIVSVGWIVFWIFYIGLWAAIVGSSSTAGTY